MLCYVLSTLESFDDDFIYSCCFASQNVLRKTMILLPKPATMDLALARPILSVVLGSLLGGSGAGDLPKVPPALILLLPLRGKVAYCL